MGSRRVTSLEELLDDLGATAKGRGELTVEQLRDAVGRRSFGPLLLVASLLGFTPIGVIPGAPTLIAITVILIAGQVAIGRPSLWMPTSLLKIHLDKRKLKKAAIILKPFARAIDKIIRPRLSFLTEPPFASVLGITCLLLALTVPPLEFVPLVDLPLWGAMVAFTLALFAHDGLLAIVAFLLTALGVYFVTAALF